MDNPNQHRRQNEPPIHQTPTQRYSIQGPSASGGPPERYRPAPLSTSPSTPRGMVGTAAYSTYYQEPTAAFSTSTNMPATALAYGSEYGGDGRPQTQNFGGYNTGMIMYNVPQPNTQTSVYDAQQFGQRQQPTMHMIPPDVASGYFSPEASAAAPSMQHPAQGSGTSTGIYQHNQPMGYASNMPGASTMQQASGATEPPMGDEQEYAATGLQEKWLTYQRQLGSVFQDITNGSLERAAETLLSVSNWLLSQVAELGKSKTQMPSAREDMQALTRPIGLSQDDASLHTERIKLWNDFNHAWLALGFRQKELMSSGQQPSTLQILMSQDTIKKIGDELIRLCDGIERHGLVDYQYGVWEDRIEAVLEECLDLYEPPEGVGSTSGRSH